MLCRSRLSASFMKFQLKLSRLCSGQGRICFFLFFFFCFFFFFVCVFFFFFFFFVVVVFFLLFFYFVVVVVVVVCTKGQVTQKSIDRSGRN